MDEKIVEEIKEELLVLKQNSEIYEDELDFHRTVDKTKKIYFGESGAIVFSNNNGNTSYLKLISLFKDIDIISKNYTEKEIKNFIVSLVYLENLDVESLKTEISKMKDIQKNIYIVFFPVYGIEIDKETKSGEFIFHTKDSLKKRITFLNSDIKIDELEIRLMGNVFIECKVKTRSKERAPELIEEKIGIFFNILRFFIASKSNTNNISLENNQNIISINLVIDSNGGNLRLNQSKDMFNNPIVLKDEHLSQNEQLSFFIEIQFANRKKTEMEKRLALGIQWIGESMNEINPKMKFLKLFFAFESLIQVKSENQTDKMAELLAFLLKGNSDERKKVKKDFKNLYSIRSNIAHGEVEKVSQFDLYYAYDLIYGLVSIILGNINNFKTLDDIYAHVDDLKFA